MQVLQKKEFDRPADRTGEDLDIIFSRLRDLKAFEKFHPLLLQQICYYSYYEDLEQGVILFRQGDIGTNWYAVLSGSLDVNISETGEAKDSVTLCTLGVGTAFGESVLNDTPRHATVITNKYCELLRVEQKDFRILWERNKQLMEGLITHYAGLPVLGNPAKQKDNNIDILPPNSNQTTRRHLDKEDMPNPAAPITATPSEELERAGHVIRTVILAHSPHMIRDRKYHLRTYRRCLVGNEMVDWLLQHGAIVHSRNQAVGMWQALLEEGVIIHVCHEHQFKDKYLFYRFYEDDQGIGMIPNPAEKRACEDELPDVLNLLEQIGPDAMMRMILRKLPHERTLEDLEIIYEELLHIKALSHLSTMVKRELASVLIFESHAKAGTVLFSQGDEGKSWYIIMKGSVNVVISGKGVVCTLHEGDDFGKLALVNDAPRAATIVLCEDNCHFLRVDKEDFNRILRDVEANTVRLKEHGKDVLVLEKIPSNIKAPDGTIQSHYKYSVMAGTPEKMLEHLLGTCIGTPCDTSDTFREDFLLTHDTKKISDEYTLVDKKRVIQFVQEWAKTVTTAFWEDKTIQAFLQELQSSVMEDSTEFEELAEEFCYLDREIQKYKSLTQVEPDILLKANDTYLTNIAHHIFDVGCH
ncbi:hypothetical protein LSH36_757g01001 [Paralvinella palmiformis]|uniref:Rap guanine nucleotide exchange factor 4 n=1 Tax=Paralvinella palmiformis TaxID=53620 RepID=A0AAD9J158_9ANNE|nr:hypothetical protein LSH36_757g01001 [Paralvinella palmiformis]